MLTDHPSFALACLMMYAGPVKHWKPFVTVRIPERGGSRQRVQLGLVPGPSDVTREYVLVKTEEAVIDVDDDVTSGEPPSGMFSRYSLASFQRGQQRVEADVANREAGAELGHHLVPPGESTRRAFLRI